MWTIAHAEDIPELSRLFWDHITQHPEYISHAELQMGVALAPGVLAPQGQVKWEKYMLDKIKGHKTKNGHTSSVVMLYKRNGSISAFYVLEIVDDDTPFGMICDMLVGADLRGEGMGVQILERAKSWFAARGIQDIYLESGVNNHRAHAFFEKHHFIQTSCIFKLSEK